MESTAAYPTGIATAAASVREVAKPGPVPLVLDELGDRLGALEVTLSALTVRLEPVLGREVNGVDPVPGYRDPDEDTRSELARRLDSYGRAISSLTRHVDTLVTRLEV